MVISKQIRIFTLGIVYLVLLAFLAVPHHHHAEVACYTVTHCEEDENGDDHHKQETSDHNHDHDSGDELQNCLFIGFYVNSDAGLNVKRVTDYSFKHNGHSHAVMACISCVESDDIILSSQQFIEQTPNNNTYLTQVILDIPHRGPPQMLA